MMVKVTNEVLLEKLNQVHEGMQKVELHLERLNGKVEKHEVLLASNDLSGLNERVGDHEVLVQRGKGVLLVLGLLVGLVGFFVWFFALFY
mgnify:CR=1 FL=1